jgi:hypothetical protein
MGGQTEMEQELGSDRMTADSERTLGRNDMPTAGSKPARDANGERILASNF